MAKNIINKYLEKTTDIYHLVDETFLTGFGREQGSFMLMKYYEFYCSYCNKHNQKILSIDKFLLNARKRKNKIIQVCCPYCGKISMEMRIEPYSKLKKELQYCVECGKKSTAVNIFLQLSSLLRMQEVHNAGYSALVNKYSEEDMKIISYDIMQMELVELASILEKTLRDFYMDIAHIKYRSYGLEYIDVLIEKSTSNDFMNFDKANNHYKKGLNINLKDYVSCECKNNLVDLVNLRNTIIHNNGMIDSRFKKSETFLRVSDMVEGNLIFVKKDNINRYLGSVLELINAVEGEFDYIFNSQMNTLIANYYFNDKSDTCN
ncbi:MAG: hypothetical protein ACI4AD_11805 [Roseburia sp.]